MKAEIKVLTVVNLNKTNEIEARNHLTDGIESAFKKSFNISAITVLGKSTSFDKCLSAGNCGQKTKYLRVPF